MAADTPYVPDHYYPVLSCGTMGGVLLLNRIGVSFGLGWADLTATNSCGPGWSVTTGTCPSAVGYVTWRLELR